MNKLALYILLITSISSTGYSLETDKAAHFGMSYAINTGMYGLTKKAFRLNTTESKIFAAFTTIVLTTAAEYVDNQFDGGDIKANILGVGASTLTITIFDF